MKPIKDHQSLIIIALTTSVILFSVGWFNWNNDHANVFVPKGMYEKFVWQMNKNKFIVGPQHFADRFLKIEMIKSSPVPDVAILGSSRILNLHKDVFRGKSFMNLWVGGALLKDYLGIVGAFAYYKASQLPKTMVITIEPWIFNEHPDDSIKDEWMKMQFYYDYLVKSVFEGTSLSVFDQLKLRIAGTPFDKLSEFINPRITAYNFKAWQKGKAHVEFEEYQVLDQVPLQWKDNPKDGFNVAVYPDGSFIVLPETFGLSDEQILEQERKRISGGKMFSIENFTMSDDLLNQFERLINYLQKNGVKVYFYFPSYYPLIYDYVMGNGSVKYQVGLRMTEAYVRSFAQKHNILTVGSFNPEEVGLKASDFVDHTHLKREPTRRLFQTFCDTTAMCR